MLFRKAFHSAAARALKLCVVGAGPAGLYTAERLLRRAQGHALEIDILDRLPFPFGLVETGVAPDHPATKNVRNGFTRLLQQHPNCRFRGNVELGRDVFFSELKEMYHGVVLACGAEVDRRIGVQGEEGRGVMSARHFVWWYNGHPDDDASRLDLSNVKSVAIVGAGNVALDCARVLLKPANALAATDMASRAVDAVELSSVEEVHIVARRSAAHVKFTPKELREILELPGIRYALSDLDLEITAEEAAGVKAERSRRRVYEILQRAVKKAEEAEYNEEPFLKTLHFRFNTRVAAIRLDEASAICGISLQSNFPDSSSKLEELDVDLLISSIGTTAAPIDGAPFDAKRGVIPSDEGRVVDAETGEIMKGAYVSGWIRRGATGIIGTNILDAEDVADAVREDREELLAKPLLKSLSLRDLLSTRKVRSVSFSGWQRLRREEECLGRKRGKEREKITNLDEMLDLCLNDTRLR